LSVEVLSCNVLLDDDVIEFCENRYIVEPTVTPCGYPIFWIDRFHPHSVKQHTAFVAKNNAEVDAFYADALKAGGRDNGPPRLRDTTEGYPLGYYAAFVLDPDGNNIEAVCRA
jgi:catechol 2,3-dioxygenase-like lactoylglutathione lyase family enzyme